MPKADAQVELDGHRLSLTNLGKVLYPETRTPKSAVIAYYAEVAHVMIPHVIGRPVTRKRWPNGVDTKPFFHKNLDKGTPGWVPRKAIEHGDGPVTYPLIDSPAVLAWMAQMAALEIHVPQWRFDGGAVGNPDRLVFDLDPGPGVTLAQCAEVARAVRERATGELGRLVPVTSGSKGIHLYARLDGSLTSDEASDLARRIAEEMEQDLPDLVVSRMSKALRPGKIFIDWSQNNAAKTTIAPYSLRGRDRPTVAAPRTWDELDDPRLAHLEYREVLERLQDGHDPMEGLEEGKPAPRGSAGGDRLAVYRAKRSAERTPEPVPEQQDLPIGNDDTFVVQEHHASRLHWDLRLERNGVLVSWAVPRGIPSTTRENRLAVHTEDHPLEYAQFSGTIPTGEYGGGDMTIWDSGHYFTEKWRDDEVIVVFDGGKTKGRYALIQTDGKNWLLHRMKDQKPQFVADSPVGRGDAAVDLDGGGRARSRGSKPVSGGKAPPKDLLPMLATAGTLEQVSDEDEWRYEVKWDGVRAIVRVGIDGEFSLTSRNGLDVTRTYPEVAEVADLLRGHTAVLDGEIVAYDPKGKTDFSLLQQRMKLTKPVAIKRATELVPVELLLFDLLHLDGVSLLRKSYEDRRLLLEALEIDGEHCSVPGPVDGPADEALEQTRRDHWEGIIAKRLGSPYLPGKRVTSWLKIKNFRDLEVVVVGWRPGNGRREGGIGSLLVAVPDGGGLRYAGRVGTGFSDAVLDDLAGMLKPLHRSTSPVADSVPRLDARDARWVKPELVGEVTYTEWTGDNRLRAPSWRGLRPDRTVAELLGRAEVVRSNGSLDETLGLLS